MAESASYPPYPATPAVLSGAVARARLAFVLLLVAAVVLGGLGLFYLLRRPAFFWDAVVLLALAAGALARAVSLRDPRIAWPARPTARVGRPATAPDPSASAAAASHSLAGPEASAPPVAPCPEPGRHSPRPAVVEAVYRAGVIVPLAPLDLAPGTALQLRLEPGDGAVVAWPVAPAGRRAGPLEAWKVVGRALSARLDLVLLATAVLVYALTHLIGLPDFPIYFFTDEAIQVTLAEELLRRGLRDENGTFLPPYFQNAEKWNLSLSVYLHALSVALFGKSVFVTRATSVAVSLLGVAAVSLMLRQVFGSRFWWAGGLVMAAIPAWFLHSRTAFETVMMVSFYACFLCAYLLYRAGSPRYLLVAMVFGAATFYSYANGQGVMLASGLLLLLSDLRYHLRQRRGLLVEAALLAAVLAVPLYRFRTLRPSGLEDQLATLHSYWLLRIPLEEKLATFGWTYLQGLSPAYWFLPNGVDLARHRMDGLGHLPLALAPFIALGFVVCLRRWRSPAHRAVLIALLAMPFSAALVAVAVTRVLGVVVPAALLACLGFDQCARWLRGRIGYAPLALACATGLTLSSVGMLRVALTDGPTWYRDYGLGGMQYGARQLFPAIADELARSPTTRVLVSPTWANNPNVFVSFFLTAAQAQRVEMVSIDSFLTSRRPLAPSHLFVLPAYEYERARANNKLRLEPPERVLPYPDGQPGFYFVRLAYVDNVDTLFAADRLARQQLRQANAVLDGRPLVVRHSLLDMGSIPDLFDGDTRSLIRGFEANPFVLEFSFPSPRTIGGLGLDVASMDFSLKIEATPADGGEPRLLSPTYSGLPSDPHVEVALPDGPRALRKLRLEITNLRAGERANIHVREVAFR